MSRASSRNELIREAIRQADDTRAVEVGSGTLRAVPELLRQWFRPEHAESTEKASAVIVADQNTWQAAGEQVWQILAEAHIDSPEPIVLDVPDLHATSERIEQIESLLKKALQKNVGTTPIAVGSGTINDLTKLASHHLGRPYMVVATAASMDGYTAFGASVIYNNAKQTMYCPAPRAVIADMDILAKAPPAMNAAGYGDLLAKIVAGADWIVADALDIEPIHRPSWALTQTHLREWLARPDEIRRGDPEALADLTLGLLMTGFGMQSSRSSRPASGAEHQFSHLWDMEHHTHQSRIPLHGAKVSIGLLASTAMYEQLLATDIQNLDISTLVERWPSRNEVERQIEQVQTNEELLEVARTESRAKYVDAATLGPRLAKLRSVWPELEPRLVRQLIPFSEARRQLEMVGGVTDPSEIGIDRNRLRRSFVQAQQIRRRFTILDVAASLGCLDTWADACVAKF